MAPVVGFVGGLFAFGAAPAIGSAAFGSWALGSAIGGTFLGSLTVKLLTTVAFSALQRALMPSQERGGGLTISTTVSGEDQPETIILGRYATGGFALCPPYSHGPSNKYLTHIIEVCSAPGATLERFMLGDEWIEFGPTSHPDYGRPATGDKYGGRVWLKYYNGTQTEADPMLIAKYGSHPDRPWTANMVGSGLCYAVLTFEYNQEKMAQVPRYRFELKGVPLYDPRKDSTAGGLGPQRISQPTTWQQTENAAVLVWNIMRGIALPGGELWGGAISDLSSLPKSAWIAAMNRCDATVDIEDGTEPMYRAGIEVSLSDPPAAAIEEILKACSGSIADLGYGWGMVAGAPSLPVYSFTDEDVIVSEKQDLDPFPGLQDTYNAVSAKFPDPKHYWETREAPQRTNAVWEASDAFGRRAANLNLAAVPFADQVQRLTLAWLNDERRFIQHTISVPPDAAHLELMDTVMWTSARNGYSNKTFQISEFVEDPKIGIRQMLIRECEASDWIVPVDYILPTPPVPQPSRVVPSVLDGFSATPLTLLDVNHIGRRGAVRIAWSVDLIGDGVRYQIRLPAAEVAVSSGTTQMVSAGYLDVFDGLLPATQYEARAQLIADRSTPWTAWLSVTTPDVRIGAADLDNDVVAAITPDTTPPAVPTALSVTTSIVSDAVSLLVASWSAPADLDLDGYEVRVKVGAGDFVVRISAGTRYEERLSPGETYSVQVRAFDTSGNRSAYTALASGTAVKDTTPPAVPTGLVINAGYQMLWVKWDPNSESDLHHYEIYEQASSTPAPTLATAATFTSADAQMARTSLPSSLTRHYWVRAVDTTGNKSAWSPRKQGTTAASAGVNSAALAGLVDATSFASGIKPVEVVATLPAAPHVQGRQVFLTSDNKLYRNTGSGWTKEVDGVDLNSHSLSSTCPKRPSIWSTAP